MTLTHNTVDILVVVVVVAPPRRRRGRWSH